MILIYHAIWFKTCSLIDIGTGSIWNTTTEFYSEKLMQKN